MPFNSQHRAIDDEHINLVNFLIERTKVTKSVLSVSQLAKEFKGNSKSLLSISGFRDRIRCFRPIIPKRTDIDTDTKVKLMFALSAPLDKKFLKKLEAEADIFLDDHQRIIKYRKKGGGLELEGIHTVITDRSETIRRDNVMLEFLVQKSIEVNSPITCRAFLREFQKATGATEHIRHLAKRYRLLKKKIHISTDYDQKTKLRTMFVSSASVPKDFLEILRKDALVEVDESNRITKYRENDGSFCLEGDHSLSTKCQIAQLESERSNRKQISSYFENRNTKNEEMNSLIKFITEKCENTGSPLNCWQLTKEFDSSCGASKSLKTTYKRINAYRQEIQKLDVLDTPTKVRQLFVLSVPLDIDFLEGLRKDALVEVDDYNRIVKYVANDGSFDLTGDHSQSSKQSAVWAVRKKKHEARKSSNYVSDVESKNDSVDDSSEEFEADSDNEDYSDRTGENIDPDDLDYEIPVRRHSMTPEDDIDYDPPTKKSYGLIKSEIKGKRKSGTYNRNINPEADEFPVKRRVPSEMSIEDEIDNNPITGRFRRLEELGKNEKTDSRNTNPETEDIEDQNTDEQVTTRSGRVAKKRVSHFNLFMDESEDDEVPPSKTSQKSSSAASTSSGKKRHLETQKSSSSKFVEPTSDDFMRTDKLNDFDPNYSFHRKNENSTARMRDYEKDEEKIGKQKSNADMSRYRKKSKSRNLNSESYDVHNKEETQQLVTTRSGRVSKKKVSDFDFVMCGSEDYKALSPSKSSSAASTSSERKKNSKTERSSSSKQIKPPSDDFMRPDGLDDYDPSYPFHRTDKNPTEASAGIRETEEDEQEIGGSNQKKSQSSAAAKKKRKADKRKESAPKRTKPYIDHRRTPNELDEYHPIHNFDNPESNRKERETMSDASDEDFSSTRLMKPEDYDPDDFQNNNGSSHDDNSTRPDKIDDYDRNDVTRTELKPFRGSLLDKEHPNPMDDDIKVLEKPQAPEPKNNEMIEAPIKTEDPLAPPQVETLVKVKNPVEEEEEVKPKFTSQLKLLEAIKSLIDTLDISSLCHIKSKINLKIRKNGELDRAIPNEVMTAAMGLLIAKISTDAVTNPIKTESVVLIHVLCYFKAAIRTAKLDGLEVLLEDIRKRIEDQALTNKRISVEKMASALQTTVDAICF